MSRYMAAVTKDMLLRWGDCPGLSGCAQCNHKGPYNWEAEGQSQTGRCYAADLKVEEGGHEPLEAEKCEETNSTLKFPEGTQPC